MDAENDETMEYRNMLYIDVPPVQQQSGIVDHRELFAPL